jgi:hypothetical protein
MNFRRETHLQRGPTHLRVAARHERARAGSDRDVQVLTLPDGGSITTDDVIRFVEARVGWLAGVRFDLSTSSQTRVSWSGYDRSGGIVRGHVELHADLSARGIVVWANVVLDHEQKDAREVRLEEIAAQGRDLIRRLREEGTTPLPVIITEIADLVDAAEREVDQ